MAMNTLTSVLDRPRLLGVLLAAVSAAMLVGAFYFQHVEGLRPCPLCIAQRWAHAASLALGLIVAVGARGNATTWLTAALGLAFIAGAGIAGYHVAVEQHWIENPFCGANDLVGETVEELKALLWEQEIVRCDEVHWSLLGISMAGYNLIISLAMGILTLIAVRRALKVSS
tara:strand:+ start:2436 stop:2948 length:513 start_codon:yes stop_codon:yes gene_type:complete